MDRRWLWLLAAALLVIAAAWLVRIPEPRTPLARPEVEMPRQLRPEERQRMLARLQPVRRPMPARGADGGARPDARRAVRRRARARAWCWR